MWSGSSPFLHSQDDDRRQRFRSYQHQGRIARQVPNGGWRISAMGATRTRKRRPEATRRPFAGGDQAESGVSFVTRTPPEHLFRALPLGIKHGARPGYTRAAAPAQAVQLSLRIRGGRVRQRIRPRRKDGLTMTWCTAPA